MERKELRKRIQGTIVTLPTPFDSKLKVDHSRMVELVQWWVSEGLGTGIAPLKVAAAMGEGPDLRDDEWPHLLRTVVNAAGSGRTILCGLKPKNTLDTIEDAKIARDNGAIGLQIDLPLFHHPNQDDYIRFFTDISNAIDIGIMIYNTWWYRCPSVKPETMIKLAAEAEHVFAIKWAVPEGEDYDAMTRFAHLFNVIDNSNQPIRGHKNGARGYISQIISAYPEFDTGIWALCEARKYDEAQQKWDRVRNALKPWIEKTGARSGGFRQAKALMTAMGHTAGPTRPPTLPVDDQELAELKVILKGLGWPVPN